MPFSASYQISLSPLGKSLWPCSLYCRSPNSVRRSLLPPLLFLHIQASPTPQIPSTSAGQPKKRWLNSREALILQPRQSRLHRWVTIKHASRLLLPLNFLGMRGSDVWDYVVLFLNFFLLVCYFWGCSCVHFSCIKKAFSPAKHAIHSHTCVHARVHTHTRTHKHTHTK